MGGADLLETGGGGLMLGPSKNCWKVEGNCGKLQKLRKQTKSQQKSRNRVKNIIGA